MLFLGLLSQWAKICTRTVFRTVGPDQSIGRLTLEEPKAESPHHSTQLQAATNQSKATKDGPTAATGRSVVAFHHEALDVDNITADWSLFLPDCEGEKTWAFD